ncbi:hypothetical protein SLA_2394 [Streptomyces laurentii]|uniref:Helix-turn-helix domain-containing protein n=1 Tax=Streptomyces laurentii TaxID=39478 RepID=A0A160NZ93_STRLU|nr:hypothetical protein SLA_2394 [Streptomyces laurentii]
MDVEQHPRTGSVPHTFGNMLARQWAPALPRQLTGGFLTLLYAMRALASADGRLRYERDGKAITIQQIAKACRSDQKDVRDYLRAAIAAGVVGIVADPRGSGQTLGRATTYTLLLCPAPDWERAAGIVWVAQQVKAEKRAARAARKAAADTPPAPATSGDSAPTSTTSSSGDSAPTSTMPSSGDSAPTVVGGQSPEGVGGQCPDHPGSTHVLPHEMAEVVPQPQDAHGRASEETNPQQPEKHRRCADGCGQPVIRPDRTRCTGCERRAQRAAQGPQKAVQGAFLMAIPAGPGPDSADVPPARQDPRPPADPFTPLRTCDCGRQYRAPAPGRCPDCLDAAVREQATRTG